MTGRKKHPAKFSKEVLPILDYYLEGIEGPILDPMAGVGTIRDIRPDAYCNEIEPEWAAECATRSCLDNRGIKGWSCFTHDGTGLWCDNCLRVIVGDARNLPYPSNYIKAIATSPTFANRLADHHNPKDDSVRHSYKFYLERDLHPDNTGQMQWGRDYRIINKQIWQECYRVLQPGGRLVFDISDHQRNWKIVRVSDWHRQTVQRIGFKLVDFEIVKIKRLRHGANYKARPAYEVVYYFEKPLDVS